MQYKQAAETAGGRGGEGWKGEEERGEGSLEKGDVTSRNDGWTGKGIEEMKMRK